ncbi:MULTISPECIES: DUF4250 domain-containing protein [Vibrio]|uniref:DUF4250 domain-containing protein n=2 Tax=Vibrio TaxID=662 RepID=A0A7X4RUM2_9VIBR|nr:MULTISPECIES: DUF4250 domain-containing protein [Vibrio]MBF9000060.1 DUF4250 domain-containing protein [Vibrio nitrifigilis]MZI93653.1 DUF4250 domain-containing protein [Vibrio eleionomae]
MELSNVNQFDPHILLGIINEKLRLECHSLDDLVITYEIEPTHLVEKLEDSGYRYDPLTNQFR